MSPTDRPTISAITASRVNRAKARIMYFCQVKRRVLFELQLIEKFKKALQNHRVVLSYDM